MKLTKLTALIAALTLPFSSISCSTLEKNSGVIGGIAAGVATVGGFFIMKKNKDDKESIKYSRVIPFERTGAAVQYGGMLLDENSLVHVMHWPTKLGQKLSFPRKSGGYDVRIVVAMVDMGNDTRVVQLNEPLDLTEHKAYPIGKAHEGAVTIDTIDKKPFGTNIKTVGKNTLIGHAADGALESGDSGKVWIQENESTGEVEVVSVSSRGGYGIAPNLWNVRAKLAEIAAENNSK